MTPVSLIFNFKNECNNIFIFYYNSALKGKKIKIKHDFIMIILRI